MEKIYQGKGYATIEDGDKIYQMRCSCYMYNSYGNCSCLLFFCKDVISTK